MTAVVDARDICQYSQEGAFAVAVRAILTHSGPTVPTNANKVVSSQRLVELRVRWGLGLSEGGKISVFDLLLDSAVNLGSLGLCNGALSSLVVISPTHQGYIGIH
jgi:hypothetical protein